MLVHSGRERLEGGSAPLPSVPTFLEALPAGSHGMEEFGTAFAGPGCYISKDVDMLWPAVPDELGDYQVLIGLALTYHTPRLSFQVVNYPVICVSSHLISQFQLTPLLKRVDNVC